MSKFTRFYSMWCCGIVGYLMLENAALRATSVVNIFFSLFVGLGLVIPWLEWIFEGSAWTRSNKT